MNDERKTKAQLSAELKALRQRVSELEAAETDRQRLDAALWTSEMRYRRLFETAQDGILLLDATTGQITDVNPFLEKLLGYSHAEFLGKHLWEIGPFKDVAESKLAFEQLQSDEYIRYEDLPLKTRHGQRIAVEFVSNVYLVNGVKVIQCNVRDITAHKQTEEALHGSEERYRAIFNGVRDAILVETLTGKILDVNASACDLYGYDYGEFLNKTMADVVAPGTRLLTPVDPLWQTFLNRPIETVNVRANGEQFPAEISGRLRTLQDEKVLLVVVRDITDRKQAEITLKESEGRFREIFENMSSGVVVYEAMDGGQDFRINHFNRAAEKIEGISRESVMGRTVCAAFPGVKALGLFDVFQRVWQTGTPEHFPLGFYQDDRIAGWRENYVIRLPSGEVMVIYDDVTERKRAEDALRDSEQRERERAAELQTIMDAVPAAIWIAHDQMCQVITGNRGLYERLRMPPQSNASLTAPDDQRPAHFKIYKDGVELPPNELPIQITAATGVEIRDFEEELVFDDGTVVHELGNVIPLFDAQGRPRGAVAAFVDITEHKQVEAVLTQERLLLRTVLDNLPDAVYAKDRQGRKILTNRADLDNIGKSEAEVLGKTDVEVFPLQVAAQFEADDQSVLQNGQPVLDREELLINEKGSRIWQTTSKLPLKNAAGQIVGLVGIGHNITERRRLESELRDKVATLQTLAEIDREIIAATEPERVLELVCRRAAELVRAPKSAIAITSIAGDEMTLTASYGVHDPARLAEEFTRAWQAGSLRTDEVLGLKDILVSGTAPPEIGRGEETRALALVPLIAGQEALGMLSIFDSAPHEWAADELRTLSMLASQAAVALEKLRLFQSARSRALRLTTLNEISQALTSSLDLDHVLTTLLEKVRQTTDAEACSVALVERASGDLVFRQAVGGDAAAMIGLRLHQDQGLVGWVAQHGQSLLVPNAAADPRIYQLASSTGFVTHDLVGVPLIARDRVTGVLELINKRVGRFGDDDVRLLESVAAQAAIAIENARLFETERAGRLRLETLYRIGQAINSTLNADTILDQLTDEAMQATQATHGSALVVHLERGAFERRSLRGYSPEYAENARTDWLPLDRGVNGQAYQLQQAVCINDVQADPNYHSLLPETRSELAVPIVRGGQVIGNLDLQSPMTNAFRDIDLQFLKALTDQVAIALENARLFEATHRQMEELSIVSQVALVGAAGRPFDETVARATAALSRLWPKASLGFLFVDETGQALRLHSSYLNPRPEFDSPVGLPLDQGLIGWATRQQRPIRVGDVTTDPRYAVSPPEAGRRAGRVAKVTDIRSEMVAPLVVGERVIGVVNVETPRLDAFSGDDLRLLTTLAGQLAVIFEKARLDAALLEHAALLEERVQERTAEIRRQQARTQAILDALGEGVVVTDLQGIIQYTNPAMEQVTGFSSSESLGQTARLWQSGQTPQEAYHDLWQTILAGETWHGEIVNRRQNGALYEASLAVAPIPATSDDSGPLAGFVGIQRDITERKRAEAALRDSEALYHSLVEVMPLSLCRKDLAGRFTFANQRFLVELQASLADLIGKTDFDIHPPEQAEKYRRDDQHVIDTGQIVEVIEERTVLGGQLTFVQTVKAPILNSAGEISGVQIAFWDVTDRIQAEEEMRHALEQERELSNLKSRFVSLTSHEFRTPLTTILSSAEMLEHYSARWSAERRQEHLQRIQASVKYMTGLLDDVLVVAKAEANRLEFVPGPLDLLKFCRDLLEEFELMDQANHTLIFKGEAECALVSMDEQLLRHIFSNLLSNALKYSPQGSTIRFDLTCQAGQAVFQIQDHGLGIPPEDQARLFETFHRARNVRNIAGTGLGLTIVKRSVDLHGGTIEVVSQVDRGTTVTVNLPTGLRDEGETPSDH
ncbi:Sensor histidine kinase WalK [Thermoflexales bacterium]|nr:Sensor histidine kinase WalK [Thermoflexales bacterium]